MRKLNKLVAILMLATITVFSACTEKEVPVPTVDTERLDALRQELRDLQLLVYDEEHVLDEANDNQADMEAQIAALKAEIARLQKIYERSLTYGLYVIDFQNNKLANATIKIAQDGAISTGTTDENGYVEFEGVRTGVVNGVISVNGYTTANFKAVLAEYGWNENNETYKTSKAALFPASGNTNGTGMFMLQGNVYANFSTLNDTLDNWNGNGTAPGQHSRYPQRDYEAAGGKKLRFTLLLDDIKNGSRAFSNVRSIIYEDASYAVTTSENGSYQVNLPARSVFDGGYRDSNFMFSVLIEEFQHDYTYRSASDTITEPFIYRVPANSGWPEYKNDGILNDEEAAILPGEVRTKNYFYQVSKN